MWRCPFCNRMYYGNIQMYCDCVTGIAPTPFMNKNKSMIEQFEEFFKNGHHATYKPSEPDSLNYLYDEIIKPSEDIYKTTPKETASDKELVGWIEKQIPMITSKKTLVLNLFSGPGAGKSTTAAGIFFELKTRGINVEIAAEYAKDLVWEKRHKTFEDQIYIFAKQYHRLHRLLGQVEVVITDCPILLSPIYDTERRQSFKELVIEEHRKMWTYNVFLKRKKAFNPIGRNHDLKQASQLDIDILNLLDDLGECYETFEGTSDGKDQIVKKVLMLLDLNKK